MKLWAALLALLAGLCATSAEAGRIDLPFQIGGAYSVPTTSLREARFSAMVGSNTTSAAARPRSRRS